MNISIILNTVTVFLTLCRVTFSSSYDLDISSIDGTGSDVTLVGHHHHKSCPHWTYRKYHNSSCICGNKLLEVVQCVDDKSPVKLATCHCMSRSESKEYDGVIEGVCPYLCTNHFFTNITKDIDFQTEDICNDIIPQNRTGQMCGRCKEGYAPSAYTYSFICVDCSTYNRYNWIKYIAIAYLPITLVYLLVLLLRLSATSPAMNANIFICQIIACPAVMSMLSIWMYFSEKVPADPAIDIRRVVQAISIIYGVWNLDFFHLVFEPICIHPSLNILQVISLDYAVALYPIFLIMLTYLFVKFHDRFISIQRMWKPMFLLLSHLNKEWRVSNFLTETFGTFFLLSYVKVINTSFALLMPVRVQNVTGDVVGTYLYYNGSMEYFGPEHRPYLCLAVFMFVTFNLIPLLLLGLYPCRCFQSCLNCCRLNCQVLRNFMDTFQGCYKFEPYDCRYWAAFYLFLRITLLLIFAFTQTGYFVVIVGLFMLPAACLTAIVRPYKPKFDMYNTVDTVFFLVLVNASLSLALISLSTFDQSYLNFATAMAIISLLASPLYLIGRLFYKITQKLISCLKSKKERDFSTSWFINDVRSDSEESPLLNTASN